MLVKPVLPVLPVSNPPVLPEDEPVSKSPVDPVELVVSGAPVLLVSSRSVVPLELDEVEPFDVVVESSDDDDDDDDDDDVPDVELATVVPLCVVEGGALVELVVVVPSVPVPASLVAVTGESHPPTLRALKKIQRSFTSRASQLPLGLSLGEPRAGPRIQP